MDFESFLLIGIRGSLFYAKISTQTGKFIGTGLNLREAFWDLEKRLRNASLNDQADRLQLLRHAMSIERL